MTKETCAAIASVITTEGYVAKHLLVSKVGQLLLSTLTTLKHAGAAFAARDALQLIATNCLNPKYPPEIRSLPDVWSRRLVDEISLNEKVRNSTLRRSTGYALGFLAIMRADTGSKSAPSTISVPLLQKLLMLSLPPEPRVDEALAKLKIFGDEADRSKIFVYASDSNMDKPFILDHQYEARCRVHALNVLRMIILDAPLASLMSPFVGDAIISAILGYDDPSWAIRNSSTMVFAAAMLRVIDPDKNASNSDKTSSNAITLTELFRRYPPLATFIPAVLRICLEEMECQGNVKSEMFPILLMLSRVQPVMDSIKTFTEEFTPLLFRCLGSKDFGIRHVAARSLSNLSSKAFASNLLSDCKQHVAQILSSDKQDWNNFDGTLLAMECLDLSSSSELLDIKFQESLFGIVNSSGIPPSCRSTALSILLSSRFVDKNSIQQACNAIVTNQNIQFMMGGSILYKTSSEGLCLLSQKSLWQAISELTFENSLSQLKEVFTNDTVDVRLYAVKRFKKGIYENIDRLRARKTEGATMLSRTIISTGLATMLLDCVASELGRGIADTTGSHIPTLRRLSRCLLEALQSIPKSDLPSINYDLMWSISHEITERESLFLAKGEISTSSDNYLDCDGGNVLSSNAVEMMAATISIEHADIERNSQEHDTTQIHDRMRILLKVVGTLNDPNGSWRSRYSAALALEACCSVLVAEEEGTDTESLRRKILMTVLEMLQDSDLDVRTVAVQAAMKLYKKDKDGNLSPTGHVLLLPEWTLERTFPVTFAIDSSSSSKASQQSSTMEFLQAMILDHCRDLPGIMQNVQEEFGHTDEYYKTDNGDDTQNLKDLVNVNTTRKIFEDEDPNPFQEKVLLSQLAIQSLLNLVSIDTSEASLPSDFSLADNTRDVLSMCDSVLTKLLETHTNGGIVHELSRYPTVFPSLHSIIGASVVALYFLGLSEKSTENGDLAPLKELRENLRLSANKLVSLSEEHPYLHPSILCALRVLSRRDDNLSGGQISTSEVERLLFLLK